MRTPGPALRGMMSHVHRLRADSGQANVVFFSRRSPSGPLGRHFIIFGQLGHIVMATGQLGYHVIASGELGKYVTGQNGGATHSRLLLAVCVGLNNKYFTYRALIRSAD